jgi:rhodanese-related sulfurtransferase
MKKKRKIRLKLLYLISSFFRIVGYKIKNKTWPVEEITVDKLLERIQSDDPPVLIDVRFGKYYNKSHLPNAKWHPILKMIKNLVELQEFNDKETIAMCWGGGLSLAAAEILQRNGFQDAKSLYGGTDLWENKGYPLSIPENPD